MSSGRFRLPQVAHYAATMFGTTVLFWTCKVLTGRHAASIVIRVGCVLVATHTRTALIGLFAGLLVGGASLFLGSARVRRTAVTSAGIGVLDVSHLRERAAGLGGTWTGRSPVSELAGADQGVVCHISTPRPRINENFGSGAVQQSFNGSPDRQQLGGDLLGPGLVRRRP